MAHGDRPADAGSAAPVLRCEHLLKRYDDRVVVDDVSFTIAPGETYGLLGPNGAGKTTVISMVCGILERDGGSVAVAGHELDGNGLEAKANTGLVPQDLALYPDLTARENLRFFGRLQGLPPRRLDRRVDEVLELIGLSDRADERVDTYSGGMKRRCNIGAGLLHEPSLLILDEPTVGVDPQSRNSILESIEVLGGEGMGVLYTTHYMEEAERLCERVGIMDEGRLLVEGTRAELIEQVGEHSTIRVGGTGPFDRLSGHCRGIEGVTGVTLLTEGIELLVLDVGRVLAALVDAAQRCGVSVSSLEVSEPDLESVFLHLTGKALRDRS